MVSAANWFPRSEDVQPNEMRIIFMGSAPFIRPGQMNTAILVELGNGDIFMFDIGEGSPANIIASGYALNEISDVFITHLHVDHFGGVMGVTNRDDVAQGKVAVIAPDRFMEIHYESIVHDQEGQTRRLLDFCGLDWDEACLRFHENAAPVSTKLGITGSNNRR